MSGKYTKGPVIPDLETLIFCLQAGNLIYHANAILPAAQYFSWPLSKLRSKVNAGVLFLAEVVL